ncbi:unnamed protein product, partial [Mesorhabditis spiculigera]
MGFNKDTIAHSGQLDIYKTSFLSNKWKSRDCPNYKNVIFPPLPPYRKRELLLGLHDRKASKILWIHFNTMDRMREWLKVMGDLLEKSKPSGSRVPLKHFQISNGNARSYEPNKARFSGYDVDSNIFLYLLFACGENHEHHHHHGTDDGHHHHHHGHNNDNTHHHHHGNNEDNHHHEHHAHHNTHHHHDHNSSTTIEAVTVHSTTHDLSDFGGSYRKEPNGNVSYARQPPPPPTACQNRRDGQGIVVTNQPTATSYVHKLQCPQRVNRQARLDRPLALSRKVGLPKSLAFPVRPDKTRCRSLTPCECNCVATNRGSVEVPITSEFYKIVSMDRERVYRKDKTDGRPLIPCECNCVGENCSSVEVPITCEFYKLVLMTRCSIPKRTMPAKETIEEKCSRLGAEGWRAQNQRVAYIVLQARAHPIRPSIPPKAQRETGKLVSAAEKAKSYEKKK